MNLLNVLVSELDEWPFSGKDIGQACDGSIHAEPFFGGYTEFKLTVASDYAYAVVSEKKWRKAKDRKAKTKAQSMSLRDYFAAKCCAAMVSSISDDAGYWRLGNIAKSQGFSGVSDWIASESYKQASAMLAAREVSK